MVRKRPNSKEDKDINPLQLEQHYRKSSKGFERPFSVTGGAEPKPPKVKMYCKMCDKKQLLKGYNCGKCGNALLRKGK